MKKIGLFMLASFGLCFSSYSQTPQVLLSSGIGVIYGKLGIGTSSPLADLDIRGDVYMPLGKSLKIGNNDYYKQFRVTYLGDATRGDAYIDYSHNLFFRNSNKSAVPFMCFSNDGKVGIGGLGPYYELDVNGTIRAHEVRVESTWADFVFAKDYKLPALTEVKAHIDEYNRLPDMPSELEVKENGIGLSEITTKLLQKVEELTLYIIQQEEKTILQQKMIDELNEKIVELENANK